MRRYLRCQPEPIRAIRVAVAAGLLLVAGAGAAVPGAAAPAGEPPPPSGPAQRLRLEPFTFEVPGGGSQTAELGRLRVAEDHGSPGRSIELAFLRFPAVRPTGRPPIVFLPGGPGGSGTAAARDQLLPLFRRLQEVADVIALDPRGAGMSRPRLECGESWRLALDRPAEPEEWLTLARDAARRCAERLSAAGFDLGRYTDREAAADLEDLRLALGVERLQLLAFSYGTELALVALELYPESLERAALGGVVAPDRIFTPPERIGERLVDLARRLDDPELPRRIERLQADLTAAPRRVEVVDPLGKRVAVVVGAFDLELFTIHRLGSRAEVASLPEISRSMAAGDLRELGEFARRRRFAALGSAMPYAFKCAVELPARQRTAMGEARRSAFLGRAVDFPFPEICDAWPRAEAVPIGAQGVRTPIPTPIRTPTLLISGGLDGRTPPGEAARVAGGLSESLRLVAENAGHSTEMFVQLPPMREALAGFFAGERLPRVAALVAGAAGISVADPSPARRAAAGLVESAAQSASQSGSSRGPDSLAGRTPTRSRGHHDPPLSRFGCLDEL